MFRLLIDARRALGHHACAGALALLVLAAAADVASARAPARMDYKWNPIVFRGGVPVGGRMHLTLRSDGSYTFGGHFHNSGFPSYKVSVVYVVKDADGRVYTFTHSGHMGGTVGGGSRNFDWEINGRNPQIAKNWRRLAGARGFGRANTSLNLAPLVRDLKEAIGVAREVYAVVGPILGL